MSVNKKLVLDADGVIFDFVSSFLILAREVLKKELDPDISQYELTKMLKGHPDETKLVLEEFNNRDIWKIMDPLPGAIEAIHKLNKSNIEVFVVTSIDKGFRDSRLSNLQSIGLNPTEVHCMGINHGHKHEVIGEIKPFAYVDDRLDHLHRSIEVPHLAWIDHSQTQLMEIFPEVAARENSLSSWVNNHLHSLINKPNLRI